MTEIRESEKNYGKIVEVSKNSELLISKRKQAQKAAESTKQREAVEGLTKEEVGSPKGEGGPVPGKVGVEREEVAALRKSDPFQ
jgi:hypothetical protein